MAADAARGRSYRRARFTGKGHSEAGRGAAVVRRKTREARMVFKTFAATLLAGGILLSAIPCDLWAEEDSTPKRALFNRKIFSDMGDTVHVEGQVTGEVLVTKLIATR